MPRAATIAFLVNPSNPATDGKELQEAASALGRPLHILPASTESDIGAAFLTLAEVRLGGLIVSADPWRAGSNRWTGRAPWTSRYLWAA